MIRDTEKFLLSVSSGLILEKQRELSVGTNKTVGYIRVIVVRGSTVVIVNIF